MIKSTLLYTRLLLVAGLLFAQSCRKDNTISQFNTKAVTTIDSAADKYSIMTNAEDPLLMRIEAGPADTIFLSGTRDKSGLPCTLDAIIQIKNNSLTRLYLDENGRPLTFVAESGIKLKYDWVKSDYARVTAFTEESGNLTDFVASIKFSIAPTNKNPKPIPSYNGLLKVTVCGKPFASDDVYIAVSGDGTANVNKIESIVPYTARSTGEYIFTIPSLDAKIVNPCDASAKMNKLLSAVCLARKVISETNLVFNTLIISQKIPFVSALEFTDASAEAEQLFDHLCSVPGDGVLACESIGVKRTLSNVRVSTVVENARGPSVPVIPGAALTTLNFDISSAAPFIRSLVLSPTSPSSLEPYTATAGIYYLPKGSKVLMSATATDGYTTSKDYTVDVDNFNGTYFLDVLGSAKGVLEKVTVLVTAPDGRVYDKTVYHVSGG
jgi:hypothetical protein